MTFFCVRIIFIIVHFALIFRVVIIRNEQFDMRIQFILTGIITGNFIFYASIPGNYEDTDC